jgi:CrcB protein
MRPDLLWVGLGGFVGANALYVLSTWVAERAGATFPFGTLLINVTGSVAIGVILTLLTERLALDPAWRLLLVVGFLGGYTTFSSYTFEALDLVRRVDWLLALGYVGGSNLFGLLAAFAGVLVTRAVW